MFEVLATLAFTLVLLVVFLLERDDLWDRIVLLAGKARLALTSKALEDVTDRISRYIVLGKNIPQLGFLNLLLGDEPAFRENVGIYLRRTMGPAA